MNMDINEKEIEKASRKIDLSGFKMQDELNPKIWDKEQKMKPEVRKTLLKIADDYFESLGLHGVDIEDVTMTGSLANYNWSKYSDVDLHIVVDYSEIPVDEDLVQDFLKSKSSNWNKEHDVKVYGYDVELYVQDINEPHHSTGVYSILNNEWNIEPEKKKISFSDKSVKDKANRLMDRVEEIYDEMDEVDNDETVKRVDKLTEKIKKMRQSGLESGGEFSVENIVFKVLRRNGMLDRLYDIKTVAYDKSVTLESIELNNLTESMVGDDLDWIRGPIMIEYSDDFLPQEGDIVMTVDGYDSEYDHDLYRGEEIDDPNCCGAGYIPNGKFTIKDITVTGQDGYGVESEFSGRKAMILWPEEDDEFEGGIWSDCVYFLERPNKKLTENEDPLGWMKEINPTPIYQLRPNMYDHEYEIVMEYFNRQPVLNVGEWKYSIDSLSGAIEWWRDGENDIIFWATPFWDSGGVLPIDYQADMGDYDTVDVIDLPKFNYEEELIEWLENEYPKIVYKEIKEFMDYNSPLTD